MKGEFRDFSCDIVPFVDQCKCYFGKMKRKLHKRSETAQGKSRVMRSFMKPVALVQSWVSGISILPRLNVSAFLKYRSIHFHALPLYKSITLNERITEVDLDFTLHKRFVNIKCWLGKQRVPPCGHYGSTTVSKFRFREIDLIWKFERCQHKNVTFWYNKCEFCWKGKCI